MTTLKLRIPKLTAEYFFRIFLVLFWGKDVVFSYIRGVLLHIPIIEYAADYVVPTLMIICLCFAFPYIVKCISWKDFLFACSVIVVYLLNILIFPENEELVKIAGTFFFSVFPLYFIGLRFENSRQWKIIYIMSVVNVWTFAAYYMLIGEGTFDAYQGANTSYMGRAYVLLPQLLGVLVGLFNNRNILNVATAFIGAFLLLMCGNRGSLVLLLLFVVFYLLLNTSKDKRMYLYIGAIAVLSAIVYFYEQLVAGLVSVFESFGWSVRVFERLAEGTFFESSGRTAITSKLSSAIRDNPVIGYGLCSDRTITGSYAHNFAYELWTSFGVVFGSLILIATVCVIIRAWRKNTDKVCRAILLLLVCTGFLKLFLSSSFLLEGSFFMLVGYCVAQLRSNKSEMLEFGED